MGINTNFDLSKRRIQTVAVLMILAVCVILGRLYYFQVIKFSEYQRKVIRQQTSESTIIPTRGTIYDRNMRILASSAAVERVFISPKDLDITADSNGKFEPDELDELARKEKAARKVSEFFSEFFELDYDFVYEKTQKKHRLDETIKAEVEISIADHVRQFAAENRITGIHFGQAAKRVYPYSNLAAHVIGFMGSDNNGMGIEAKYNEYLKGMAGRMITVRDARKNLISLEYETYIGAQNGNNLILTLDYTVQTILEEHLEVALMESRAAQRVAGVVMDVHTGEILAMSTKPDFDLNNPRTMDEEVMGYINLEWDDLNAVERDIARLENEKGRELTQEEKDEVTELTKLYKLWKNKIITEPYEPGSTFKVLTAAVALEEKVSSEHNEYYCAGMLEVGEFEINCHLRTGHGHLTFAEGLKVSCNPVSMMTAEKITAPVFLKYFDAFGYNEKTGIDLPGEAVGLTHGQMGASELATSSFGQTFKVTPIQHAVGLAAVANGGKIVTPRVVRAVTDSTGNIIKNFEPEIKRTVLSGGTSKTISRILAEGVSGGGSARNAFVRGYEIAAKTGTSQKLGRYDDEEARIGSTAAYAPAENPQVVVLIIVDEPDLTVSSMYGGVIAAPYVSKVLNDALPYLGVEPQYTETEIAGLQILVRGYTLKSVSEAAEDIVNRGLSYVIEGGGEFVKAQIPRQGSQLIKGGEIVLYTDSLPEQNLITVPDVSELSAQSASKLIKDAGFNINIIGASSGAAAYRQNPEFGEQVPKGTVITVEFRHQDSTE